LGHLPRSTIEPHLQIQHLRVPIRGDVDLQLVLWSNG
jgi:hypothetical protein